MLKKLNKKCAMGLNGGRVFFYGELDDGIWYMV